jgi:sarcosine oxidase
LAGEFELVVVGLGGIGSAAAYWGARELGTGVLGLERFELRHARGASQDHSRIFRLSYHAPEYVRFAQDSVEAWAAVEEEAGEPMLIRTGGLDLFPAGAMVDVGAHRAAMDECAVAYEVLDGPEAMRRWPQWRLSDDVVVLHQADAGIVPAARCNATHRRLAREHGATLVDHAPVTSIRAGEGEYVVEAGGEAYRAANLVLAVDAWTNDLLGHFGMRINLRVTQAQVAYFASSELDAFAPERFPIWIWQDDPGSYGLPAFGEAGAKIGEDAGVREVTGDSRTFDADPDALARVEAFMQQHLPGGFGPLIAAKTCLYAEPPDRDFVLDRLPGHPNVVLGQGAAHAFKFASVFGRSLVELVLRGYTDADVSAFSLDRAALTADEPPRASRL